MTKGLIILGSEGGLGSAVRKATQNTVDICLLFDKQGSDNTFLCDLENPIQIEQTVHTIDLKQAESWSVLIATGIYNGRDGIDVSWEETQRSLEINLLGVTQFVIQLTQRLIKEEKIARFVIVTSAAAKVGSNDLPYGVAKAGLEGLIRSISKKYASLGITVLGISPGIFESSMSDAQSPERRKEAVGATHTKRPAFLTEVTAVTVYALLEAPDALTGTFLNPAGGQIA